MAVTIKSRIQYAEYLLKQDSGDNCCYIIKESENINGEWYTIFSEDFDEYFDLFDDNDWGVVIGARVRRKNERF